MCVFQMIFHGGDGSAFHEGLWGGKFGISTCWLVRVDACTFLLFMMMLELLLLCRSCAFLFMLMLLFRCWLLLLLFLFDCSLLFLLDVLDVVVALPQTV